MPLHSTLNLCIAISNLPAAQDSPWAGLIVDILPHILTQPHAWRTIPIHAFDGSWCDMKSRSKFPTVMILAAGIGLAACNTPPARQNFPDITFQHLAPFKLDVAHVEIVQAYRPDPANDIADQFPEAPAKVAAQWAEDRLQAVGTQGQAIYTITLAKATDTPLKRSQGMAAMTHKDQSDRYDLAISVNLEIQRAGKSGALTAQTARSQTVAEDMTLNQREAVLFNLLDATMKDLNKQLEGLIPQYVGGFLK
jgi:hypothetical protein